MPSRLTPIAEGITPLPNAPANESFAVIGRAEMTALAHAMPDAQSAVLFCLSWHAALNERMRQGPLAGRRVARASVGLLGRITGRPVRTVKDALKKLRDSGLILRESRPGQTSVYRVTPHDKRPSEFRRGQNLRRAHAVRAFAGRNCVSW